MLLLHTIVALIFPQHQKQNTKSKTAMPHSPDAMAPGIRTPNDVVDGIRKKDIPVKRFRRCVLEGIKTRDSRYRHQNNLPLTTDFSHTVEIFTPGIGSWKKSLRAVSGEDGGPIDHLFA
jgi:hypothetical protein